MCGCVVYGDGVGVVFGVDGVGGEVCVVIDVLDFDLLIFFDIGSVE